MKKFTLGLITGLLFAAIPVSFALSPVYKKTFNDVNEGDWFYEYVTSLATQGIIDGYLDGNFGPNDNITRAQVSKLLYMVNDNIRTDMGNFIGPMMTKMNLLEAKIDYIGTEFPGECYINGNWFSTGETDLGGCTCEEDGTLQCG